MSSDLPSSFKGLAVTATPIGNLGDLTPRARDILASADIIACEDTRHTGLLLSRLGITPKKLAAYHDHSKDHVIKGLVDAMAGGKTVALVSDAGTPLISDPGYRLVSACIKDNIPVTPLPGLLLFYRRLPPLACRPIGFILVVSCLKVVRKNVISGKPLCRSFDPCVL